LFWKRGRARAKSLAVGVSELISIVKAMHYNFKAFKNPLYRKTKIRFFRIYFPSYWAFYNFLYSWHRLPQNWLFEL